jgi:hypothetical protein
MSDDQVVPSEEHARERDAQRVFNPAIVRRTVSTKSNSQDTERRLGYAPVSVFTIAYMRLVSLNRPWPYFYAIVKLLMAQHVSNMFGRSELWVLALKSDRSIKHLVE